MRLVSAESVRRTARFLRNRFAVDFLKCALVGLIASQLVLPASVLRAESLLTDQEMDLLGGTTGQAQTPPSARGTGLLEGTTAQAAVPSAAEPQETVEQAIEHARMIRYSQDRWNEMRRRLEEGGALIPEAEKPVPTAERKTLTPAPPPLGPGINVVLPYESGLSISGRKVIDFKLSSTIYAQPDLAKGRVNKTDFELDQQLQVRVKGTVGRKVSVNVDFDDTREDKRDISVTYKGDPDEILQEAAFGDITISLPSTEFVQYSKSVFGARAELMFRPRSGFARLFPAQLWHRYLPKTIKTYFIGSRTKGITQTKRFTGQSLLQRKEINDISYLRRQFYQLAFATGPTVDNTGAPTGKPEHRPIQVGSERIFLDDQNPNNNNVNETTRTFRVVDSTLTALDGVTPSSFTFVGPAGPNTGVFKLLVPGVDYTVDYVKGFIRFRRQIQPTDILVADYLPVGQTSPVSQTFQGDNSQPPTLDPQIAPQDRSSDLLRGYEPILIKPDETQFFATRELKNFYSLGDTKIVRDDGRGNFILKIQDLNRNDATSIEGLDVSSNTQVKPVPKYPDQIDVDFESGIFSFVSSDSFRTSMLHPFTDDIYLYRDVVPNFKNRYRIFAQYSFRKGNFSLDQTNIVSGSEQVFLDGRRMTRDVDYFIDYDAGIVTFFRPEIIRDDSVVEITYDYSPFGGQGEETLVGLRNEFYITDNLFVGGSVMFNFAAKPQGVPDLRSTPRSITVLEGDFNWKNVKFGNFPIQMTNLSAEVAQSIKNPNTSDKAIIESFEGAKLDDSANLNRDFWQPAANPETGNPLTTPAGGAYSPGFASALSLSNEDVRITDINPGAPVESSDRIPTLRMDYNLSNTTAASVVQVLSREGADFFTNRKQFAELWIQGDGSGARLQVRYGGVNEANDSASVAVKTEDADHNGLLSPGEDVGYPFVNPDGSTTTVGAGNGLLDTQDLNANGRLDPDDGFGNYSNEIGSDASPLVAVDGSTHTTVDWTGWKIFQVPLNIATTAQAQWSAIKDVRITVVNPTPTAARTGTLRFARISAVGTRFEPAEVITSTTNAGAVSAQAFAENSEDNPGYPTLVNNPAYQDLYDLQNQNIQQRREQALAIQYQRTANIPAQLPDGTANISTVTVRDTFTRPLDLSEHKKLKFFLYGDMSGNQFVFRLGSPGNYFEYHAPLNFTGWRVIEINIEDKNRDGQPDALIQTPFVSLTQRVGAPSLRNVSEITMGVLVPPGGPDSSPSKIYVNEIHLTDSLKIVGNAYRANADFSWAGWGTWGARWRSVDRNFETLTSVSSGQDSKQGNLYLNLNRLSFLPLNTNLGYSETVTPQIQTVNDPNVLISVLDEGKVINTNQNMSGNFLMTQLPYVPDSIRSRLFNVDFSADHSLGIRSDASREDETFNYRYGTSYALPWQPDILPGRTLTFRPLPTSVSYSFSQTRSITRLTLDNTETNSVANSYSLRSAFQFFPQLQVSPAYSLSEAYEERSVLNTSSGVTTDVANTLGKYNKNMNQAVSLAGSLRVTSWLTPTFNYSINTVETNNINAITFGSTTFRVGDLKTISRNSNADISASLAPKDMFQYFSFLRPLNQMINTLSFSGGYTLSDGDTYENVDSGFYSRDKLIIRGRSLNVGGGNPNARRTNLTATDTSRLSGRWYPFEGLTFLINRAWAPLKNISASGTFTETKTRADVTGTQTFTYSRVWPDFIMSTSEIERPLRLARWVTDTRLNGSYQERITEVAGQTKSTGLNLGSDLTFTVFKLLQFSVGYTDSKTQDEDLRTLQITNISTTKGINGQVITTLTWGNWRFTPRYDQSQSESENGKGQKTSDLTSRNVSLQVFGDINIPRFFRLPFGKQLALSNRLIVTSSTHYGIVRDGVDSTKSQDTVDFNLNGDFEITPNIRAAFGGGFSRVMFKVKKENDYMTLTFTSRITIQF